MRAFADKLMDLAEQRSRSIAELWYKAVSVNPRMVAFRSLPKEWCLNQAELFLRQLRGFYFSDKPYDKVRDYLENYGYAEYTYARGIPLHEAVYALILLRRQLWLYSDMQAMYQTVMDFIQGMESINRTILLFDYAVYLVSLRYMEMKG